MTQRHRFVALLLFALPLIAVGCLRTHSPSTRRTSGLSDAEVSTSPTSPTSPTTANPAVRTANDIPTGTVAQAETLLVDVRALDPSIVVDLRYLGSNNFTGAPLAGYAANHALLERQVASAFARAQVTFRASGLGLKVFDAYRPVRATRAMVAWTERVGRTSLVRDGYISDRSRHNLGVAVDCTLIRLSDGTELDMGTPFDTFDASAHTANATGEVAANRALFVAGMAKAGFVNYDQEWWHFSYDIPAPRRFDMIIR